MIEEPEIRNGKIFDAKGVEHDSYKKAKRANHVYHMDDLVAKGIACHQSPEAQDILSRLGTFIKKVLQNDRKTKSTNT